MSIHLPVIFSSWSLTLIICVCIYIYIHVHMCHADGLLKIESPGHWSRSKVIVEFLPTWVRPFLCGFDLCSFIVLTWSVDLDQGRSVFAVCLTVCDLISFMCCTCIHCCLWYFRFCLFLCNYALIMFRCAYSLNSNGSIYYPVVSEFFDHSALSVATCACNIYV